MGHGHAGFPGAEATEPEPTEVSLEDGWMGHGAVAPEDEAPSGPWRQERMERHLGAEALSGG